MTEREAALKNVTVGDLLHATSPNNASLICLVEEVTTTAIHARSITSRYKLHFDRSTGTADFEEHGRSVACLVDSVQRLPPDVLRVVMDLDRKYGAPGDLGPLTEDEKRALVFATRFYPQHPLALPVDMMAIGRERTGPVHLDDYDDISPEQRAELILANFLIPDERR